METGVIYQFVKPAKPLADFIESFWMLRNTSGNAKEIVILPDGRIDLSFSMSADEPFHATLLGLETQAGQATIAAGAVIFAVSFKLLATEYILNKPITALLDNATQMPPGFWDISAADLDDFPLFCEKVSMKIQACLPSKIDERKRMLFDYIYTSKGEASVKELSEKSFWSSRQINRYFNQQYGISLKKYCNILRFRASFQHIKEGKLFPESQFADQSHFIREIKKMSGFIPKELHKNENDRFIQFTTLRGK